MVFWFVRTSDSGSINVAGFKINKSNTENLLGVKFVKKLTFDDYIFDICKKAGRKISTLARVTPYMRITKKHTPMNAFFRRQFSYCPLVWIYLNGLLEKDGSISIHIKNIQILPTQMYILINNLPPPIMNRVFKLNSDSHYNLRQIFGKIFISRSILTLAQKCEIHLMIINL